MNKIGLLILLLLVSCKASYTPKKSISLTDELFQKRFIVISMITGVERYNRTEVDFLYFANGRIMMHSIVDDYSKLTDTIFAINGSQMMLIDHFEKNIKTNTFFNEFIFAGSRTDFKIQVGDGKVRSFNKAIDYSLFRILTEDSISQKRRQEDIKKMIEAAIEK